MSGWTRQILTLLIVLGAPLAASGQSLSFCFHLRLPDGSFGRSCQLPYGGYPGQFAPATGMPGAPYSGFSIPHGQQWNWNLSGTPHGARMGQTAFSSRVPVTSFRDVVVDSGSYQTVWVPNKQVRRVAQTTWQNQLDYRPIAQPYTMANASPASDYSQFGLSGAFSTASVDAGDGCGTVSEIGSFGGAEFSASEPGLSTGEMTMNGSAPFYGYDNTAMIPNNTQFSFDSGSTVSTYSPDATFSPSSESAEGPIVPVPQTASQPVPRRKRVSARVDTHAHDYERPRRRSAGLFEPVRPGRSGIAASRYTQRR